MEFKPRCVNLDHEDLYYDIDRDGEWIYKLAIIISALCGVLVGLVL